MSEKGGSLKLKRRIARIEQAFTSLSHQFEQPTTILMLVEELERALKLRDEPKVSDPVRRKIKAFVAVALDEEADDECGGFHPVDGEPRN